MPDIPRLNGVIKALEQNQTAFVAFTPVDVESAVAMASSKLDGVAFEMEHAPLDFPGLRQALQFMLDRRQMVEHEPQRLRSEEHTSELQSRGQLVCRLLLETKNRIRSLTTPK